MIEHYCNGCPFYRNDRKKPDYCQLKCGRTKKDVNELHRLYLDACHKENAYIDCQDYCFRIDEFDEVCGDDYDEFEKAVKKYKEKYNEIKRKKENDKERSI